MKGLYKRLNYPRRISKCEIRSSHVTYEALLAYSAVDSQVFQEEAGCSCLFMHCGILLIQWGPILMTVGQEWNFHPTEKGLSAGISLGWTKEDFVTESA